MNNQRIDASALQPWSTFWEDRGGKNYICRITDYFAEVNESELRDCGVEGVKSFPVTNHYYAYISANGATEQIHLKKRTAPKHEQFFSEPQNMYMNEKGQEVPLLKYDESEELFSWRHAILYIEDEKYLISNPSLYQVLDQLIEYLYPYSNQKYTTEYLMSLHDSGKEEFIRRTVEENRQYIEHFYLV